MMKFTKTVKYAAAAAAVLLCEQIFGKYIALGGVVPMLTFCFCITVSMFEKDFVFGVWFAAITGAVCDLLSGHGFGTYTVIFAFAAIATIKMREKLFSSDILFLICDVIILTIVSQILYFVVHINDIGSSGFMQSVRSIILPMTLYNTAVSILLYPIAGKMAGKRR